MIKKSLAAALGWALLGQACDASAHQESEAFQGVVELETRSLSFEIPGRVSRVLVAEGGHLEGGGVLAELDDGLLRPERDARVADLEAARAQRSLVAAGARAEEVRAVEAELASIDAQGSVLARARARQEQLLAEGATPSARLDELDTQQSALKGRREVAVERLRALRTGPRPQEREVAEARVRAGEAAVAAAEARLARCKLVYGAPADVLELHGQVGEVVAQGVPFVTVADLGRPYVDVFVPQAELGRVSIGAPMWVRIDALAGPLRGRVQRIGTRAEFTPRFLFSQRERANLVIRVRVAIADPLHQARAGVPAFAVPEREGQAP